MSDAHENPESTPKDPAIPEATETQLNELKAQATAKYSMKDYDAAAELYSQASELQDQLNGEMSPQNADLLYAYGRCLYHLAVRKSDLLGSKLPVEDLDGPKPKKGEQKADEGAAPGIPNSIQQTEKGVISKTGQEQKGTKDLDVTDKGFVFTGDENFENDSDNGGDTGDEDEEPEDDFANAYEILDTSRVLLTRRIEAEETANGKGKTSCKVATLSNLKERLADTHDLQAEISLEGERFSQAVDDLQTALDLKLELFPQESSLIAEAHYKLSLALEFSSSTQEKGDNGNAKPGTSAIVDTAMREEAAMQMEKAIASCRLRVGKEKARLGTLDEKASKAEIADVEEMVNEMEERVSLRLFTLCDMGFQADNPQLMDLCKAPSSSSDPQGTSALDEADFKSGILGSLLGESPAEVRARLEAVSNEAKDVSGLVKKKKPNTNGSAVSSIGEKRKADLEDEDLNGDASKKARIPKNNVEPRMAP